MSLRTRLLSYILLGACVITFTFWSTQAGQAQGHISSGRYQVIQVAYGTSNLVIKIDTDTGYTWRLAGSAGSSWNRISD